MVDIIKYYIVATESILLGGMKIWILFLSDENNRLDNKIHIFQPFVERTVKKQEMMWSISSVMRIRKIRHLGSGFSFMWILQVVYFQQDTDV